MSKLKGHIGTLFIKRNGEYFDSGITGSDYNALEALTESLHAIGNTQGDTIRRLQTEAIQAQSELDNYRETIKGLDRANQRYKEIIEQYRTEALEMQKKLHFYEQGHTKRDGHIERLHDRIMDGETVIELHEQSKGGKNE